MAAEEVGLLGGGLWRKNRGRLRMSKVIYSNTFSATLTLASLAPSVAVAPFAKFVLKFVRTCTKGQLSSFMICVCMCGMCVYLAGPGAREFSFVLARNWK